MRSIPLHWQIVGGMLIGAAVGLTLNVFVSDRQSHLPEPQLPPACVKWRSATRPAASTSAWFSRTGRFAIWWSTRRGANRNPSPRWRLRQAEPQVFEGFQRYGRSWARWFRRRRQAVGRAFSPDAADGGRAADRRVLGHRRVWGWAGPKQLGRMFVLTLGYFITPHCWPFCRSVDGQSDWARTAAAASRRSATGGAGSGNLLEILLARSRR
jgi:hypothetical protein